MKDFALELEGCSKADRKRVIKAAKSVGCDWLDSDRFNHSDTFTHLKIYHGRCCGIMYDDASNNKQVYQMPRDWNKIQEALGIEVDAEPKDGEIWTTTNNNDDLWLFRSRGGLRTYCATTPSDSYFDSSNGFWDDCRNCRKATPEEEQQLIKAEHDNGYHWDGKELVKIPEYIFSFKLGSINKVEKYDWNSKHCIKAGGYWCTIDTAISRGRTKEAFEAQEAKNKKPSITELEQTIKTLSGTADLLAKENAELLVENKDLKEILDNIKKYMR